MHRILIRIAVRHQRGRREYALAMSLNNSSVYVTGETEIIGIDDQISH
jgi:hypothetical protein